MESMKLKLFSFNLIELIARQPQEFARATNLHLNGREHIVSARSCSSGPISLSPWWHRFFAEKRSTNTSESNAGRRPSKRHPFECGNDTSFGPRTVSELCILCAMFIVPMAIIAFRNLLQLLRASCAELFGHRLHLFVAKTHT